MTITFNDLEQLQPARVYFDQVPILVRATNGSLRGRWRSAVNPKTFAFSLAMTKEEADFLMGHYTANIVTPFEFTWQADNTTHLVLYKSPPSFEAALWGGYTATIELVEA